MYSFILAVLLVSINALTPIPTESVTSATSTAPTPTGSGATPIPTFNGNSPTFAITTSPTPAPITGTVSSPPPTLSVTGISPVPTKQSIGVPTPGPTPSPATVPSLVPTKSPINGALSRCMMKHTPLDIIFIVDSSGSVWDDGYKNWENELELVYDIIDNVIPINSRVALINFSGCGSSYSFIDCKNQNRMKLMFGLNDNGIPNDLDAVLSTVDAIDQDDFNGGYTWTNEALGMALTEFAENTSNSPVAADTNKMIILITDGEPYPYDQGHEPCKTSTGYVSPTLQSLQELGVAIITVGIDISQRAKDEFFDCISGKDFYFDSTFDSTSYAPTNVPANGIYEPSPAPTASPTKTPVSGSGLSPVPTIQATGNGSPTMKPTPSPTGVPGSSQEPTLHTTSIGTPSPKPTKSPASAPGTTYGPTPNPVSTGTVATPRPTATVTLEPTENGSPTIQGISNSPTLKPTPSPTGVPGSSKEPTLHTTYGPTPNPVAGTTNVATPRPTNVPGTSLEQTANGSPSHKPTKSPSSGSGLSPAPTPQATVNNSPTFKPTPNPTGVPGSSQEPTANGSPSRKPTPSPTRDMMHGVPTHYPSPAPIVAVEDLSDSIGDFICSELGSERMIVPTTKPTSMPIGGGNAVPTRSPTPSPIGNIQAICQATADLDIVFMVDSSGSVYDDGFNNWQSELDLVSNVISSLPTTSTRTSLINFSGCGSSFSYVQCRDEQGRLNTVFDLNTYGTNLDMVSSRIEEMDSDDFLGGYTWTNEALGLALEQFNSYSNDDKTKVIVLLTDGEPYPYDQGHEACVTSTNYESDILKSLNELDVNIITVGIDISAYAKEEVLGCVSELYFGVSQFSTLNSLSVEIGELICNEVGGDFKLSLQPTLEPTPSPVSNATPVPISAHITSNGIMANICINLAVISGFIAFLLF